LPAMRPALAPAAFVIEGSSVGARLRVLDESALHS
jgi:hypothetical protein